MKLLFINPNSTAAMTDSIVATARATLPDAEVLGWTNADGPAAIQGAEDGEAAVPGLLALLPKAAEVGADVIVIACFDDTGLDQARAQAHCPVIGIGQAAFHMAALNGPRFAVLTTLPVSVPVIEGNVSHYGFNETCMTVAASGIGVLAVEEGSAQTLRTLAGQMEMLEGRGASSVILGCAGMSRHRETLQAGMGIPLIDGVRAAALLARALVAL